MYTLLLCLIYLAFISLGLPDSLLGSGWPVMHLELGVPVSYMGVLSTIISLGTILSSLFSSRLTRRFGTSGVTVASVFITAAALLGFSLSRNFFMLMVFAVPYGLGAGAIDAALNNFVAQHYSSRHMSWLHCFWGVGTIPDPGGLEPGLPDCGLFAAGHCTGAASDPAGMEEGSGTSFGRGKGGGDSGNPENPGGSQSAAGLFRLLCH